MTPTTTQPKTKAIKAIMSLLYLSSKGFVNRPFISVYPSTKDTSFYTYFFSPIYKALRFPIKGNPIGSSSVSILFSPSCPTTILHRVVSAIINSFNRGIFFAINLRVKLKRVKHFISKLLESIPTRFYTSSPVVVIISSRKAITSAINMFPNYVEFSSTHSMPVFRVLLASMVVHNGLLSNNN